MTKEAIHYELRFPIVQQHWVEIEAFFPTIDHATNLPKPSIELFMPVWTPGSYLIREYARNIEAIEATDADSGRSLVMVKLDKNRWSVACDGANRICVRYILYCHEASVRTNWVEEEYGFLTGAATFITLDDNFDRPHTFEIHPPSSWTSIACSLPTIESNEEGDSADQDCATNLEHSFRRRASSFDELVDSPILMGDLDIRSFDVSNKRHYLASYGTRQAWDLDQAAADCAKIVEYQHRFWGEVPYPSYWFINLAIESYGGLEHDNNTVLVTSLWAMRKRSTYVEWLGLVSHEFFHTWNVRRLRPKNLMQYDYGSEQFTPELWIAEGITSYFDDLIVLRAGLATPREYLDLLGKAIVQVEETPGRNVQSLKDSSFDTWIKHYRPDENAINSRISYYTKGSVVAFLLDIHLRSLTDDRCSLADVMRELWRRFRHCGYTLTDFESLAAELAAVDLTDWFEKYIHRCEPLDYAPAFERLGLRLTASNSNHASSASLPSSSPTSSPLGGQGENVDTEWEIGCETALREGRIVVTKVIRNSPASIVGLQADDELIAFNDFRLPKENWKERLASFRIERQFEATIARRGRIQKLVLKIQPRIARKLQSLPEPTDLQSRKRNAWLFDSSPQTKS